jgi:hypothetical protein
MDGSPVDQALAREDLDLPEQSTSVGDGDAGAEAELLEWREIVHQDRALGGQQPRGIRQVVHDAEHVVATVDEHQVEPPALARHPGQHRRRAPGHGHDPRGQLLVEVGRPDLVTAGPHPTPRPIDLDGIVLDLAGGDDVDGRDAHVDAIGPAGRGDGVCAQSSARADLEDLCGTTGLDDPIEHESALEVRRTERPILVGAQTGQEPESPDPVPARLVVEVPEPVPHRRHRWCASS